jgi:hypothetical protein
LENIIRDGIRPRIAGLHLRTLDGFTNGLVLLIRIQKSYVAPHMVTFQEHTRFYSRNSKGKYPLDVGEIRAAFALSESLPERIRQFRDERLARIIAGETPVPLPEDHVRFVLHLLPIRALDPTFRVDPNRAAYQATKIGPPCSLGGYDHRYNFDGFLTYATFHRSEVAISYVQLFRNGAIEVVEGGTLEPPTRNNSVMRFSHWEAELIKRVPSYFTMQQDLGLEPPTVLLLSISGVKGYGIGTERHDWRPPHRIERDTLILPDILVENYATPADAILRPAFDAVWQAAGWNGSQSYNKEGRWVGR